MAKTNDSFGLDKNSAKINDKLLTKLFVRTLSIKEASKQQNFCLAVKFQASFYNFLRQSRDHPVRAVASDTSGPQFESSHRQNFIMNTFTADCRRDENKEKEAGNGSPF